MRGRPFLKMLLILLLSISLFPSHLVGGEPHTDQLLERYLEEESRLTQAIPVSNTYNLRLYSHDWFFEQEDPLFKDLKDLPLFSFYRDEVEEYLAITETGFALKHRFELMEGVSLIGSYQMEGSPLYEEDGDSLLLSRTASGEIAINTDNFLNMGITILLVQEDQDRLGEHLSSEWPMDEWETLLSTYSQSEDRFLSDTTSFWEEGMPPEEHQRAGIGVNFNPFDGTVLLADYILKKESNDLSTRITSLGLEYEDERSRLLAKYELKAGEDNRTATAMAGLEWGILPWGNLLATFQWANQEYVEEIMKESILNLGLDIFLSDSTSLLVGYTFLGQDRKESQDDLYGLKERSNLAEARLKFRF